MPDLSLHETYWEWAEAGWQSGFAHRYPMGKGAVPAYSYWAGDKLDYIEARKRIYIPLYTQAVRMYALQSFNWLRELLEVAGDGVIMDYDAYDHQALGYSWEDVINDPDRKMGHGFVLAMMLDGFL